MEDQILEWAKELQSIAQAGLYYGKDVYDQERYQRVREIAAQMLSMRADLPMDKVVEVFCSDICYQTPKVDTRAAIFRDGKILLVREMTDSGPYRADGANTTLPPRTMLSKKHGKKRVSTSQ